MASMFKGEETAPMCDRCFHAHASDEKCLSCGHHGRLIIFPGPEDRHPPPPSFHAVRFDTKTEPVETSYGNWKLGVLMRTKAFIEEMKMVKGLTVVAASGRRTETSDEDEFDNGVSRHIMGFLGDAPVSFARWRMVPATDIDGPGAGDSLIAVIDRLVTVKEYRRRGHGKSILAYCFTDILQACMEINAPVSRVSMFIPVRSECLAAAQTAVGSGMQQNGAARADDPLNTFDEAFIPEAGIQEFAISAHALTSAYENALENATFAGAGEA